MKHFFKTLIIICIFISQLMINSFHSQASDNNTFPQVGISTMVEEITEDQAKWAYAYELSEQIQPDELRLMSAIIWCEAGNQCDAGRKAVGIVVMNRVNNDQFEDSVEKVIYEPGQFRSKTDGALNKALKMYDTGTLPIECVAAAMHALSGQTTVNYEGQEIDMSSYLYFARDWANERIRIQDHDFR